MKQKKKVEYHRPQVFVVELDICKLLCASIAISKEEVNTPGRVNQRSDADACSEQMWSYKYWE